MINVEDHQLYWLDLFKGELPLLNWSVDKTYTAKNTGTDSAVQQNIDQSVARNFTSLVNSQQGSLSSAWIALVNILLFHYSKNEDYIIGTSHMPLRINISAGQTFNDILAGISDQQRHSAQHDGFSLHNLQTALHLAQYSGRNPLSDITVLSGDAQPADGANLLFRFSEDQEAPAFSLAYNSGLYSRLLIEAMANHLERLMEAIVRKSFLPLQKLDYLSGAEKAQLVEGFNQTSALHQDKTVLALFEEQVILTPDRVSLTDHHTQVSYRELNETANQFSAWLTQHHHIEKGDLVGIQLPRSQWMIISILGIMKSGAAYLPIDPEYHAERISYMVSNSGAAAVITATEIALFLQEQEKYQQTNSPVAVLPDDLVYVIYTSGSTGLPKGCALSHSNLSNYIQWANSYYFSDLPEVSFGLFTSLSFDLTVTSIYCPLTQGGKLVIYPQEEELSAILSASFAEESPVNCIKLTPSHIAMLSHLNLSGSKVQRAIVGGEEVNTSHVAVLKEISPNIKIYNEYGPTETTVGCIVKELQPGAPVLIGKPIDHTAVYILHADNQLVPIGLPGEICISGAGLARGYLNNPDLTALKFVANPFIPGDRMYRTGDLGRWLPDGEIDFLGRKDEQVKIRGYRIELGEIETALHHHPAVKAAVVVARADSFGDKKLVAYIVAASTEKNISVIREYLAARLPEYMLPSSYVFLDHIPTTTNGKTDKKALPAPDRQRPEISVLFQAARTEEQKKIARAWAAVLDLDQVGINDNFFELGGNSLLALKTVATLASKYHIQLAITRLYQYPTVAQLAASLGSVARPEEKAEAEPEADPRQAIAIIGMAGRFPGASTIDELWAVLRDGRETTSFFSAAELDASIPAEVRNDADYVAARGVISDADQFDAAFFGLNPKLAELMDPQQRVFLEISRDVLESSGHLPGIYDGIIGVFAGSGTNTYFPNNVTPNTALVQTMGNFLVNTVNEKDYISSRTAYQLDLKGPAVSVFSACSTSLLAVSQAVESLRKNQCTLAIAGGASITAPINSGHIYQEGAMLSRDGHCRSFDAQATGTVFSDGAGVVLLKTLTAAQADGDTIYGIIKGVGVNNDGGGKGSFTAPNTDGQALAIAMAIRESAIDPATITYVEAHGTATPLGDPIEVEGLRQAFGPQQVNQYCAIGSIKSNMGHLTAAAGVAGLIKTTLAMYHKVLLPSINYAQPNPNIDFQHSPFYVNTVLKPWESATARRAGVSSFGVGGTNVHVVVEEYDHAPALNTDPGRPKNLFTWSAKSPASLQRYQQRLSEMLGDEVNLADMASTLQRTRIPFNERRFAVAATAEELQTQLLQPATAVNSASLSKIPGETVFLFPGQGAQYPGMGAELYRHEAVFTAAVDECADILSAYLDQDIRRVIYPATADEAALTDINATQYTQPALFVVAYGLAKLWMSWGITPSVLCGHSIGEYVAAHLSGIFSLHDGLKLIASRGKLVSELPRGSMLSIRANIGTIEPLLPVSLSVAAVNSDNLCVVAGSSEEIDKFMLQLQEKDILHKKLLTSHAFHSHLMDPILPAFAAIVAEVTLNRPQKPIVSTVTGRFLSDAEAQDPAYWTNHLRQTVQFSKAVDVLMELENPVLIECGPGNVCTTLVWQHAKKNAVTAVASLDKKEVDGAYDSLLKALGRVWLAGLQPNWDAFYQDQPRRNINLPAYAYDKKLCWVSPKITPVIPYEQPIELPVFTAMRKDTLVEKIKQLLENASGIEMDGVTPDLSFVEIGLDSLLLTQVAITLKKEFAMPITFRQLNEEYSTIEALAAFIDQRLPPEDAAAVQPAPAKQPAQQQVYHNSTASAPVYQHGGQPLAADSALGLIAQQLQLLSRQVELLTGQDQTVYTAPPAAAPLATSAASVPPVSTINGHSPALSDLSAEELMEIKKPFGATARIERVVSTGLNKVQEEYLAEFTRLYNTKTAKSKSYTQENRAHMADPRVVSGFRPTTKELVYSIVINKSAGSHFWDIDGNEYLDALNGFGSSMLGYQHPVIKAALLDQVEKGYEIGPQHELSGEVTKIICEMLDTDRAALCNTGSEAVLGAMRIARTVTGRSLIVAFTGSYHGIVDEVIARGSKKHKTFPAAPGIMPEAVQNMLILDYGTEETLQIIRERADELAAVLVEPVQSRRPEFQPIEFLRELRTITENSGSALIFDEVISGFRFHPAGIQGMFGIKADLGTYGKVAGGGISVGIIAGKREFMDALDGGFWSFGDDSIPEIGVTYFAGTFVRHPLTLATTKASLNYLRSQGPQLQEQLNARTTHIANRLNEICTRLHTPFMIAQFCSIWRVKFLEEYTWSELFFTLMRYKGIHILDGFPCFLTTAHSDADIERLIATFEECVVELKSVGFIPDYHHAAHDSITPVETAQPSPKNNAFSVPPVEGARLGKDKDGNPGWFVQDDQNPGKYLQVN